MAAASAVARWTALRIAWHAGVLGGQTLVWHYGDLERRPLAALQALCRFLRLDAHLSDNVLLRTWSRSMENTPLRFREEVCIRLTTKHLHHNNAEVHKNGCFL